MRKNNKFKIEEFQLSEELEAVLHKGHRWHLGLVWVIFLINVLWFALMVVATIFSKDMPQIMVHPIILLALLGIGSGIFKTAKAIKAEGGK